MRFLFWTLIFFLLTIFQAGFLTEILGKSLVINIVFLVALSASLIKGRREAFALAVIAGFFLDIFSGHFFGPGVLALALTCLFSSVVIKTILTRLNVLVLMTTGIFMTFLYYGLFSFFSWLSTGLGGKLWLVFSKENAGFLLGQLALNAFLFLGVFYLIKYLDAKLRTRRFTNF